MQTGGYTVANYVWDLMQARNIVPFLPAVEAYYNGLRVSRHSGYYILSIYIHLHEIRHVVQ